VKRRALVLGPLGLAGAAGVALAQTPRPAGKIGYLHPRTIAPDHPTLLILRRAWQALGYVEGQTVLLRSADDDERRLPALVNELIGEGAGVLIVVGAAAVRVASQATRSVPIVAIDLETDPVRAGYAASFARPGGNVTGLFLDQPSLAGKWIELLLEAAPEMQRLALLWDRSTGVDQLDIAKAAARAKGFDAVVLELGAIGSFDEALRPLAAPPRTGIVPMSSPGFVVAAADFAAAALKYRLPTIGFLKAYAKAGLLMSYGPVQDLYFARAVAFADRILKGAKPGELPIEGPDRFELVINLKTAKAIGLKMPHSLLLRADEVIR
jgi:putative tryptophan/tyrosine transport system substrate-binding protein